MPLPELHLDYKFPQTLYQLHVQIGTLVVTLRRDAQGVSVEIYSAKSLHTLASTWAFFNQTDPEEVE